MKSITVQQLLSAIGMVLIPLNGVTFGYVLSIEKRLARLETIQEIRGFAPPRPAAAPAPVPAGWHG